MQVAVEAEDLVPGEIYTLEAFDTSTLRGAIRETVDDLIARPHEFLDKGPVGNRGALFIRFASDPGNGVVEEKRLSSHWLPGRGRHRFFTSRDARLGKAVNRKAKEYTIRKLYENRTGTSGQPGHGPANTILKMAGIGRKYGGRRRKSTTRKSKNYRKRKQTRKA